MSEPIACLCPHCQVSLKLKNPDLAGKKIKCPKCSEPFVVTQSPTTAAPVSKPKLVKKPNAEELPSEDDWLNEIDDHKGSGGKLPPVVGRKKPKKERGEIRERKRSEEGRDLPLAVHYLLMAGTGLIGGLVGAAIWAGLIYFTGYEIGYVAVFVGALAGIGVRVGANQWDYGMGPGLAAVAVAILALIAGKVVGYQMLTREVVADLQALADQWNHENHLIAEIAYEVQEEMPEGTPLSEPALNMEEYDGNVFEIPPEDIPKTFPKEVWAAALDKWNAIPAADRELKKKEQEALFEEDFGGDVTAMFGPFDLLWFILAIGTAYRIATGEHES